ncbi:hypothetical protein CBS101457_002195 [Exobasidium rhododendri]|nr:hypothetical protein CBS101457_002195 [Exobasidium rhododendri]
MTKQAAANKRSSESMSDSENKKQKPKKNSDVEAPKTGWEGPIPNREGGSEEGYLFKPPYAWSSKGDLFEATYLAACQCMKVEFEFHGDPLDAKHCHCKSCQQLHGAPFQWACLYNKTSVRLKSSCDPMYLKFYSTQVGHSDHCVPCKVSCKNCGGHLFDEGRNMIMAYPSSFRFKDGHVPGKFAPSAHIFYGERVMNVDDDVPKWSGHKEKSELMDHAPDNDEKTMGKGKRHKAEEKATA